MTKAFIAEFVGTFILVVVGAGSIVLNDVTAGAITHLGISFVFGSLVTALVLCIGKTSGCHINPAVTIALAVVKKIPVRNVLPYITSQICGAVAGGFVLKVLSPKHETLGSTLPAVPLWQSFVIEFVISATLLAVILFVIDRTDKLLNIAVTIGFTIFVMALVAGPYTGASMNPARSIGPAAIAVHGVNHLWLYTIAPIGGMVGIAFLLRKNSL